MKHKAFQVKVMTFFNWKFRSDCKKNRFNHMQKSDSSINSTVFILILSLFLVVFCMAQPAYCQSVGEKSVGEKKTKSSKNMLHYSLTLYGQATGSFISKPEDKVLNINNQVYSFVYPGFAGVAGGGGLNVALSWKALNLELGYLYTQEEGKGNINNNAYTISQSAHHLPLSFRLALPSDTVSPSIFGGPEWVFPNEGTLKKPSLFQLMPPWTGVQNESYTAWHFGIGFDFMIDETFSIPLRIKGVYAPAQRETLNDLLAFDLQDGILVKSNWEWQAMISLGLTYRVYSQKL